MSSVSTKKVFIESAAEQQENLKNQRKTLKVLQTAATDKENLTGRPTLDKLSRLKAATESTLASTEYAKRKKIETRVAETQTSPDKKSKAEITVEDLTSEAAPSETYWERLAEKRRLALDETLTENQRLNERISGLEDELNTSRKMLEEARNLVEVLTEMLNENEAEREIESEGDSAALVKQHCDVTDDDGSETKFSEENDANDAKSGA